MKATILRQIAKLTERPDTLEIAEVPEPQITSNEVLIKVSVGGVCHTELDEIEGRRPPPHWPVILSHQVIGTVEKKGGGVKRVKIGIKPEVQEFKLEGPIRRSWNSSGVKSSERIF